MYELMRQTTADHVHPTIINKKATFRSTAQCRAYAFCKECEHRLNVGGEAYIVPLVSRKGSFPFLEKLGIPADPIGPLIRVTLSDNSPLDRDKIAYFALSIFGRNSAVRCHTGKDRMESIALGEKYNEQLRLFLLGQTSMPANMWVAIKVCTDALALRAFYIPPVSFKGQYFTYTFVTLGIVFFLAVGKAVPMDLRDQCFMPSSRSWILAGNCEEKLIEGARNMRSNQ
jgi:hypothetical protein